jgi:hypothetical protein
VTLLVTGRDVATRSVYPEWRYGEDPGRHRRAGGARQRLARLTHEFASLGRTFEDFDTAIGSHRINDRLSSLAGNWSDARRKLGEHLEGLSGMAEGAAAEYRRLEAEIAATASEPVGG